MKFLGQPCWYELGTTDLDGATAFYSRVLGWDVVDSGMEGFQYRLAKAGSDNVAGMMHVNGQAGNPPPNWLIYFAADDIADTCNRITQAGGAIHKPASEIPGTGLYAIVADPQGTVFGLIQPDMSNMSAEDRARVEAGEGAFNQSKVGHACWNQLMSRDPVAGWEFYSSLFGWARGQAMDMGADGTYQLFRRNGADIGAMMGLGDSPYPNWLPYFGVAGSVSRTIELIGQNGGHIHFGPDEVPGPAFIAVGHDPQDAWFAIVGPEK